MLGFGPSKTTDIKRLTKEQLAHVFQVPKKKDPLNNGLYNKRGSKILKDQIDKEKKRNTKRLYTKAELRKMKMLQEQKLKERKRRLWEDWWSVISNVTRQKEGAPGADGTIGSSPIGYTMIR